MWRSISRPLSAIAVAAGIAGLALLASLRRR